MNQGQRIECTEHDGAHKGTVVAVVGKGYGVAWNDQHVAAHRADTVWCAADRIRPAV